MHKASWQALTPSLTQANAHFNFNFHCRSAPNHPGKGSDPPKIMEMPIWTWKIFPKKRAPNQPGKGLDPPPNGQCPNRGGANFQGASLTTSRPNSQQKKDCHFIPTVPQLLSRNRRIQNWRFVNVCSHFYCPAKANWKYITKMSGCHIIVTMQCSKYRWKTHSRMVMMLTISMTLTMMSEISLDGIW